MALEESLRTSDCFLPRRKWLLVDPGCPLVVLCSEATVQPTPVQSWAASVCIRLSFTVILVLFPGSGTERQWRGSRAFLSESFQACGLRNLQKAGLRRDLSKMWPLNGTLQSLCHSPLRTWLEVHQPCLALFL